MLMADWFGHHQLAVPFRPMAELLSAYRERDPDKLAIVDLDQAISIGFGEMDRVVTDIAADLKRRGVAKGDKLVLLSDENLEKLLIWFGIWRIGAVVCPLNVEMNSEHVAALSAMIGPKLVLIHRDLDADAFTLGVNAPICRFGSFSKDNPDPSDDFFSQLTSADPASLPERNTPEDLSCIFCTSGTTSKPKLVVYDHAAYWLSGLSTLDMLGLTEDDKTLEYRSFGWNSAQVLSLMPFLQTGLTMHIAKRFSHSRFFEWIKQYGLTFSAGVPTVVNMLLNKPLGYTAEDIPTLRPMTCSTAPLSPEQWERFESTYGLTLLQLYGMSEAGWICGNRHDRKRMGTVGPPAKHQEFMIVDREGNKCAPNVEGEVTVGGPQTAIGCLQPDGSIDPFRGKRNKTGDLAVMDDDGFVRVTGRRKDLIIRGGMNISPLEIDEILLAHDNLLEAASVGVPDPIYGEEVVAFAIPKPNSGVTEKAILDYCETKLPLPKRPKKLFFVDRLPKNDRGKIMRDKLRDAWSERARANA
jgi:acyl-coenzyme A synthetase/AMP-(fatty) acid ligase